MDAKSTSNVEALCVREVKDQNEYKRIRPIVGQARELRNLRLQTISSPAFAICTVSIEQVFSLIDVIALQRKFMICLQFLSLLMLLANICLFLVIKSYLQHLLVIIAFLDMQTERQASYPSSLLWNLQSCLLQS